MVQQAAGISYVELDPKLVSGLVDPDLQTREATRRALDAQFARNDSELVVFSHEVMGCLLYTSPSPRDQRGSRMPSSA